ncbi:A/G-specific adenine glycosylase [Labilithrix luteola]|uniref:Adenine DNA glycosylase n=1 Tax=Labilithrix luteola TaxID=1391654 RepID=A0A0K1Q9I5_9BACT|nr:A/G-specific adenine glycosylase [Labilithrix luteola]AKV02080.1 A/G-specific adenine glycosylase [Labilithrix luteola]
MPVPEDVTDGGSAQLAQLQEALLRWYAACRRDLPWRNTRDAYAIWVSEVMLQQTRVDTVLRYYDRFLQRFPTPVALAEAPSDDVLAMWSGLGYYRRARLLHRGAQAVAEQGGALPSNRTGLLDVPGIGRYTSGAIASIAFGEAVGLVDGNVARVLARLFAIDEDMRKAGMRTAEKLADKIVAKQDPGAWNQALMELGATVCSPVKPACHKCPVSTMCRARAEQRTSELPVLSPKAKPLARKVQSLVVTRASDGAVLLARRTPDRLFGGLWEPPSIEGSARSRGALTSAFGVEDAKRVGSVEHVLSHRKLTVDVLNASVRSLPRVAPPEGYDDVRFVAVGEIERGSEKLGIATLARKILTCAGVLEDA